MPRKSTKLQQLDRKIGKKIKSRRIFLGMSRQELAEQIDITQQQLQKYENGLNRISASRLYDMAEALNVQVVYFFDDLDDMEKEEVLSDEGQRMCIEVARNFMKIDNKGFKSAINNLVKILSDA
ncbi:MAG: helix-turn-helix transcriptional regulator [Sphingobacteriia bacterium]|nr:helix-turn-helix transcriptional regulator [Sphingobacteriia bacterium]